MKKHIPNFLTCCNLLCGCIGIVQAFEGNLIGAAYLTLIAAVFDFLDGMTARLLKAYSDIGKELDSLADMVTFGVMPAIVVFQLLRLNLIDAEFCDNLTCIYLPYVAFLLAIFSAIRLAIFNVDTRQSESFIGVPTPANAIFFNSLPLILQYSDLADTVINNVVVLIGAVLLFSYLMVSPIPLFSLKFKSLTWQQNKIRYLFLALSLVLVVSLSYIAIPLIIVSYIILSLVATYTKS